MNHLDNVTAVLFPLTTPFTFTFLGRFQSKTVKSLLSYFSDEELELMKMENSTKDGLRAVQK